MSSREIAELTKKKHKNVLNDIKRQEPAYLEVFGNGLRFQLVKYVDAKGEERPEYQLTKSQSLFVVSGYNPVLRARIQKRWEELEILQYQGVGSADGICREIALIRKEQLRLGAKLTNNRRRLKELKSKLHFMSTDIGCYLY
ncbi:phage regulatory protein, rha family [Elysia marginata]|uniref:Phage regulatory protein, rha family n=1 Tax=Elysia marginata TaxID=1093978 RepID=A0AAV4GGI1_9GAST|nr:phage regulatory protein, rha family [Elysia marginata]